MSAFIVTGLKGFEPLMTESESVALPLGDSPSTTIRIIAQTDKIFKYFLKFFYFRNFLVVFQLKCNMVLHLL